MSSIPTYVWPFIFAVVAAIAGRLAAGRPDDDPGSLPAWILYAVAVGCVVIGFVLMWLSQHG
jgi:TRAP-type mannitol/chloroaromatic compound transport system permease small subunit